MTKLEISTCILEIIGYDNWKGSPHFEPDINGGYGVIRFDGKLTPAIKQKFLTRGFLAVEPKGEGKIYLGSSIGSNDRTIKLGRFVYHSTPPDRLNDIIKAGILPASETGRSHTGFSNSHDYIYFFPSPNDVHNCLKDYRTGNHLYSTKSKIYEVLEVDIEGLETNWYRDPQMRAGIIPAIKHIEPCRIRKIGRYENGIPKNFEVEWAGM